MATAELAVAIPALLAVLSLCLGALSIGVDQVRCVDAARLGARALARGEPEVTVRELAGRAAPPGARVTLARGVTEVRVAISAPAAVPGLPGLAASAESVALRESP